MAKENVKFLGKIKKVHDSGMVETDKGFRANIKADIGTPLEQCLDTRNVRVQETKTAKSGIIELSEYDGLSVEELAKKFNKTQLKQICKQKKFTGYASFAEPELCNMIVFGNKNGEEDNGGKE